MKKILLLALILNHRVSASDTINIRTVTSCFHEYASSCSFKRLIYEALQQAHDKSYDHCPDGFQLLKGWKILTGTHEEPASYIPDSDYAIVSGVIQCR